MLTVILTYSALLLFATSSCASFELDTSSRWYSKHFYFNNCGWYYPRGCPQGRVCVKLYWFRTCVKPVQLGGECGNGIYKQCVSGLRCIINRCLQVSPRGGSCSFPNRTCAKGNTCSAKICTKTVGTGEKCEGKGLVCKSGLSCVGPSDRKVCKKLVGVGGRCSDPFGVCKSGLKCNERICMKVVGFRAKCDSPNVMCDAKNRLSCVGLGPEKLCLKLMDEGGSCINPWWRCKNHLYCKIEGHKKICRRRYYY